MQPFPTPNQARIVEVVVKIKKQGLALILVLSISSLIMLLLGLITHQTIQQLQFASRTDWQDKAYLAAYSGLQLASSTLEEQPYFGSTGYTPADTAGQSLADTGLAPGELPPTQFQFDKSYRFLARVCNNSDGSTAISAWDDMEVPPGKIYVRSDGSYSDKGSDGCVSLRALLETSQPVFNHAIFGQGEVSLTGSSVDSFNSTASGRTNFALATNKSDGTPLNIDGSSTAMGNLYVGAETTDLTAVKAAIAANGGTINTNGISKLTAKKKLTPYSVPTGHNSSPMANSPTQADEIIQPSTPGTVKSYHKLDLSQPTTIKPGTYYIDETVDLKSGCQLTVDISGVAPQATNAPGYQDNRTVFLYIKKSFSLQSGASIQLPEGLSARNFQVMMIGENNPQGDHISQFSIEGQSECTMTASGWGMEANLTNSSFKGALQGSTVSLNNSQLHYDESLRTAKLGQVQNNTIFGEVFNRQVTTNPALTSSIFTTKLGSAFTDIQPVKYVEIPAGQ